MRELNDENYKLYMKVKEIRDWIDTFDHLQYSINNNSKWNQV